MIEKQVWIITDTGRGLRVDIAPAADSGVVVADEPSHIHIPRPSRVQRPTAAATPIKETRR